MSEYKFFKSSVFRKQFISYLIFLFTVLFLFSRYMYSATVEDRVLETKESNQTQLMQAESMISNELQEIKSISNRMGMDKSLLPYQVKSDQYTSNTMETLLLYKNSHNWIDDIFLYFDENLLYTTRGTQDLNVATTLSPYFHGYDQGILLEELTSRGEKIISKSSKSYTQNKVNDKLFYFIPLRRGASEQYGKIVFVLDKQPLVEILKLLPQEATIVLDSESNEIIHFTKDKALMDNIRSLIPGLNLTSTYQDITLSDEKYLLSSTNNDALGWQYFSLINESVYLSNTNQAYYAFIRLLLIFLFVGFILSAILSLYHYLPFNKLYEVLNLNTPDKVINPQNEFEFLNYFITDMMSENKNLQNEIQFNYLSVRNFALTQLLEGNIDFNKMDSILKSQEISLNYDQFTVFVGSVNNPDTKKWQFNAKEYFARNYHYFTYEKFLIHGILLDSKDIIIFIVGSSKEESVNEASFNRMIESFSQNIQNELGLDFSFGAGNTYATPNKIKQSYLEALTTFENKPKQAEQRVTYFSKKVQQSGSQFAQKFRSFSLIYEQSLKEGDKDVAMEALYSIRLLMNEISLDNYQMAFYTHNLIHTTVNIAIDYQLDTHLIDSEIVIEDLPLDQLIHKLGKYVELIVIEQKQSVKISSDNVALQMVEYIEKYYISNTLSLEEVATQFNYSVSYTSRLIKDYKGISFTEYLQQLRIDEFKHRLIMTDLPIKKLVLEIGYVDVSSFTRKFKSLTGTTPAEYRKKYK